MVRITRRKFGTFVGATGLAAAAHGSFPLPAYAQGKAKVVIIGGGAGGASVAHKVKASAPELDVFLVEIKTAYTSCFFSNLFLGGLRTFESITHTYDGLKELGVNVIHDLAESVDADGKKVQLLGGSTLDYDRLVLSPGIDIKYDTIEGYSPEAAKVMPHAWQAGQQTQILRDKIHSMEDGGVVVLAAPPNPYRCPPGPYERICMIAHVLKTKKPKSKLILLDPKPSFSKQAAFMEAFKTYYDGIVEVNLSNEFDDFRVNRVDPATGEVHTVGGRVEKAAVANIVPAQKAGLIAHKAGCTDGDWCPIKPDNMSSALVPNVYVLGDSSVATQMPKSAFSANSQARVVAADIVVQLTKAKKYGPRFRNTCWSAITVDDSIKVGANYKPGSLDGKPALVASGGFVSKPGEEAALRRQNFAESFAWYDNITRDIFAKPV